MHVTTFYSFKGGVGRTMALVNIAAILARKGKRVLVVDFDLEAPGLPSYEPFNQLECGKGLVDYVLDYIDSNRAPNVADFIQSTNIGGHKLWIMPAGARSDSTYAEALNGIDWQDLYETRSGFLLMEDLKQQWAQYRKKGFDYVLIDSRTGHTDVGGICTRQLPDAVVAMFVPTKQNVDGLVPVVEAIRREGPPVRRRPVSLHFCASNVPDLDDADGILSELLDAATRRLKAKRQLQIVNHYPSLELLQQKLFAVDHPTSRLARQYGELCREIIAANLEDREGALITLRRLLGKYDAARMRNDMRALDQINERTAMISAHFPDDGEIAVAVAKLANRMVRPEEEIAALTVAITAGYETARARLQRAVTYATLGEQDNARRDLLDLLLLSRPTYFEAKPALEMLRTLKVDLQGVIRQAIARTDLEPPVYMALLMAAAHDRRDLSGIIEIGKDIVARASGNDRILVLIPYTLLLIANRQFEAAMRAIGDRNTVLGSDQPANVFNYGAAEWGETGKVPTDLFERVLELQLSGDANSWQCHALCHMALGQRDAALVDLDEAQRRANSETYVFSCWSYLNLSVEDFNEELAAMRAAIEDGHVGLPLFARTRSPN